ncbi:MAG TPA: phage major capsid protein [Burkholderiales bacterium]
MSTNKDRPLSFVRLILGLQQDRLDGEERELLEEYAHRAGVPFDPHRPVVPFAALRALTKASAPAGGYVVGTETQNAVDVLRPYSVTARAGIIIETGLVGDQVVPKVTEKSTAQWLDIETQQVTPSAPTLAEVPLTPKMVGDVVRFSRRLATQANAEAFVRRELLRTIGTAIDQAVLNGSGASGEPRGLLQTAGVSTETGTDLGHAGAAAMKRKVADANAPDEAISYIGTPAVRELLETRERAAGSGFVWDNDRVAGRPARVTTDLPAATLVAGAWEAIYLGIWGDGFVLEINPFDPEGFKIGRIEARVLVACDVAVLHPAAFCKSAAIT